MRTGHLTEATTSPDILDALAAHMTAGRARTHLAEKYITARRRLDGDWRNEDVREAMLRVIDLIEFAVVDRHTITATAPHTHNGRIWAYLGGDALRDAYPGRSALTRTDDYTFTLTIDR